MPLTEFQRTALIAALFVIAAIIVAMLGIFLLTVPESQTSTQFDLTTTKDHIIITHAGGESLWCDFLTVQLNDEEIAIPPESLATCPWSIGEAIAIPFTPSDVVQTIRVIYHPEKSPVELFYAEIEPMQVVPEITATAVPPPTGLPATPAQTPTHTASPTPTPGVPAAAFSAEPREGPVPLMVHFYDGSAGMPDAWSWSFGDGGTSSRQNPLHTYTREGSYQVSLAVQNDFGGHTRISQGYITVRPANQIDLILEGPRGAAIFPEGFLECTVGAPGSRIKIGGRNIDLPQGTRLRLVLEDGGGGKISIRDGAIMAFSFDRVTLSLDGSEKARGVVQEILVQGYEDLISSLELVMEPGSGDIRILQDSIPVPVPDADASIHILSIRPDSSGTMTLDCSWEGSTFFQGAVTSYSTR